MVSLRLPLIGWPEGRKQSDTLSRLMLGSARMRSRAGSLYIMVLAGAMTAACSSAPVRTQASKQAPPTATSHVAVAPARVSVTLPSSSLTEDQRIVHVLNRLGYGPRPGDVERVREMGLAAYLDRQLDPARLSDERAEAAVQIFPAVALSVTDVLHRYPEPDPKLLAKVQSGEMSQQELRQMAPLEKRPVRMVADYERTAIRPHALGKFRDLLLATARHPAMLFYLDNWMSTRADLVVRAGPQRGRQMGLNENYAREIMELHTLGVDGGYTQQDVIDVARAFTGWSIEKPREQGTFVFRAAAHDQGEKHILGHVLLPGGGEADGVRVVDILSRHPSTAKFIATKLVRRFVSDDPPPALVERAARTFRDTDGDIRLVMATILSSPEFFSPGAYRAKIKTPLEIVASSVRALNGELAPPAGGLLQAGGGFDLAQQVGKLGEPLYQQQPPTGYPDVAEAWVNTGALLNRMNFALGLTANRVPGVRVDLARAVGAADRRWPERVLDMLLASVLHGQATPETRAVLAAQLDNPEIIRATADDRGPANTDVEKLAALVLGSPEFQRR